MGGSFVSRIFELLNNEIKNGFDINLASQIEKFNIVLYWGGKSIATWSASAEYSRQFQEPFFLALLHLAVSYLPRLHGWLCV